MSKALKSKFNFKTDNMEKSGLKLLIEWIENQVDDDKEPTTEEVYQYAQDLLEKQ